MTTATAGPRASSVGNERKKADDKQITFRLAGELHSRLEATADGLSLDISSLLRSMIRKHLPEYEDEADEIRRKEQRARPEES